MRVIAGSARGKPLKGPRSRLTRPTGDKVKGAIFSMLAAMDLAWDRVLDLYAGSGALGIEALSRGAGWADFVEADRGNCLLIQENLAATKLAERAKVYCWPVARFIRTATTPYDIIILDPPYADPAIPATLHDLAASPLVAPDTTVVLEHTPALLAGGAEFGRLQVVKTRTHGSTSITILRVAEE